jgi:hypothetical protein
MLLLFGFVVVFDAYLRSRQETSIPVIFDGDFNGTVTARARPDFLWQGKAWYVKVESDNPVAIEFDGGWTAIVPPGENVIYHTHDSNNTEKFGPNRRYELPTTITVRKPTSLQQ